MYAFLLFIITSICCIALIRLLLSAPIATKMLDLPNHRSLHKDATPRIGGIGIITVCGLALISTSFFFRINYGPLALLAAGALILFLGSLIDDLKSLKIVTRLFLHAIVTFGWVAAIHIFDKSFQIGQIGLSLPALLAVGFGIIWVTNLYNFMDGADGLAASMTIIGLGSYAVVSFAQGHYAIFLFSGVVAAACLGFLYFNYPLATVFMGDCGSIPIGFVVAGLGFIGVVEKVWSVDFAISVFAMFWLDASFTLLSRLFKGKKFWEGHNEHWYQKVIRAGVSSRHMLVIHVLCNGIIAVTAVTAELVTKSGSLAQGTPTILVALIVAGSFGLWANRLFGLSQNIPK
jgi:UDP-N-acetylmuramyl pentapeptide phosphotransferase/UDP-N-acetylglucosamine-1-phosphate transferase